MKLCSYATIYNLGHKAISTLLDGPVLVEEKIDGSQFSFGRDLEGNLHCRSKGQELIPGAAEKMFAKAVEAVSNLDLHPGWVYRGEYLTKPKHNTLAYSRVPNNFVILFDINDGEESYLPYGSKATEAKRIGLEVVPLLLVGPKPTLEELKTQLEKTSILGGQKIEGVVIKPEKYDLYGLDKKVLMGKHVSEAFKEIHGGEWRAANPTSLDIIQELIVAYKTPARWNKAIQHLSEAGALENTPRDIGFLMKELPRDVAAECEDEIKERLWKYAWPKIARGISAGFPEYYKERLLASQFEADDDSPN